MATKAAYKRLTKEYMAVQKNPPPYMIAKPLEKNILEWHYVLRGPPETPYHNGEYHGVLLFPPEYPFKPPSIRMTTPSGRFQPDTRLCLSMSDFHPSTWNPSWSVATILTGLLSFMTSNEATTGSIKTTDADKKIYAARSHQFNLNDPKFREYFPELCIPEAVPVEILYPMSSSSSSTSTQTSADTTQSANHVPPAQQRNGHGTVNQRLIPAARNQNLQRQRRILDQWRKWIILSLVCLYLVIAKLLYRTESVSGSHGEAPRM
ncbi:2878_t:CDS:2 [Cetraspora pellucida]|uniref:Ubiquitin-conjugating enzyme E2 6 n=2 Tax=Gigasporaceae TaxID=36753 RepID=A0A9N9BMI2_9GLOM|nr:2878_t:CDS:2 [Cetraspora pellucida]